MLQFYANVPPRDKVFAQIELGLKLIRLFFSYVLTRTMKFTRIFKYEFIRTLQNSDQKNDCSLANKINDHDATIQMRRPLSNIPRIERVLWRRVRVTQYMC